MSKPSEREEIVEGLLGDLGNAASIPAKQRAVTISSTVNRICTAAYEEGLSNASLDKLIDIITLPNELDQASNGNLIRNLYPANKVQDNIIVKVVGSFGHGRVKPSYTAQAALLRWLVMVYDVLEDQCVLSRLYSILFNLLDTIAIRPQLCHVLSLITRRKHVRPFRIQALMELMRRAGNEPPLVGLMRVYKDYYPDVIISDMTAGRASVFTHPNQEWRQRLGEIQDLHLQRNQASVPPEQRTFRVTRRSVNGSKRGKSSIIPEVHTSHAQECSTTLEEIENVSAFVLKLEKIELPNQLVAVIGDPLLQKFLQLKSSSSTSLRIDNWLLAFFEDQLETPGSERNVLGMLEAILKYTRYSNQLPLGCVQYLRSMIYSWNGITGRQVVLDLLANTPIGPFEELYQSIFQPMEEAILDEGTIESKLALLTFYKNLLRQWTLSLLVNPQPSSVQGLAISELISHANSLALTIIQNSLSVSICSTVLDFYETTVSLISHSTLRRTVRITIPPAELVYTLFFTQSLSTLSRLCSVLALYKRAFETAMSPKTAGSTPEPHSYPKEYVNLFNGFIMDLCNCLWRSRAFNTSDGNSLGCLLSASVVATLTKYVSSLDTSVSLPGLFNLSHSPVLCLWTISWVRELEDKEDDIEVRHGGPVTQSSLKRLQRDGGMNLTWPEYRLGVLHYLEKKGFAGVVELMYNTMKHLMTARDSKA